MQALRLITSIQQKPLDASLFPHRKEVSKCEARVLEALKKKKEKHCNHANGILRPEIIQDVKRLHKKDYSAFECAKKFDTALQNLARRGEIMLSGKSQEYVTLLERGEMLYQVLQSMQPALFLPSQSPNLKPNMKKKEWVSA